MVWVVARDVAQALAVLAGRLQMVRAQPLDINGALGALAIEGMAAGVGENHQTHHPGTIWAPALPALVRYMTLNRYFRLGAL